jgi:hypothetical protein
MIFDKEANLFPYESIVRKLARIFRLLEVCVWPAIPQATMFWL